METHVFTGSVVSGHGKGKELGIPTLNVSGKPDISEGVYAVRVRLDGEGEWLPGAMHYGARPTFEYEPSCEVHVIDEDIEDPVEMVDVEVVRQLRGVEKFDSAEDLIAQLRKDIDDARAIL